MSWFIRAVLRLFNRTFRRSAHHLMIGKILKKGDVVDGVNCHQFIFRCLEYKRKNKDFSDLQKKAIERLFKHV
jgi:hypothetical protein